MSGEEKKVTFASCLGTVFEWYDFYLYGSLAPFIAKQFFSALDPGGGLHLCAAGVCGRFHRATVWGAGVRRSGRHDRPQVHLPGDHPDHGLVDLHRRLAAQLCRHRLGGPIILIILRMLQGLALGGEYGGAATDVAES